MQSIAEADGNLIDLQVFRHKPVVIIDKETDLLNTTMAVLDFFSQIFRSCGKNSDTFIFQQALAVNQISVGFGVQAQSIFYTLRLC